MKLISISATLLALALPGCSDDSSIEPGLDGSIHQPDGSALDANLADSSNPDASAPDAYVPPTTPSSFKLSLRNTQCFGVCPSYSVVLDQTGKVDFEGGFCAARPGRFTKQVPPADALSVYQSFVAAGYFGLGDRYQDKSDGCGEVWSDGYTSYWSAEVDGRIKAITRYEGCMRTPDLTRLDALAPVITRLSAVESWIGTGTDNCGGPGDLPESQPSSYKVAIGTQVIGRLELGAGTQTWQLSECGGASLATGTLKKEFGRSVLLGVSDAPFTLPTAGTISSITLRSDAANGIKATAFGIDAAHDVQLVLSEATGC